MKKLLALFALLAFSFGVSHAAVRTVVFIQKETVTGQFIFIKGGHDAGLVPTYYTSMSEPITYNNLKNPDSIAKKQADASLDWGTESSLDWTCNVWPVAWGAKKTYAVDGYGEDPENTLGLHYWKFDANMEGTTGEWFEFKSFMRQGTTEWWENNIAQAGTPQVTINHWGKKGYKTVVTYGANAATFTLLSQGSNTPPTASFTVQPATGTVSTVFAVNAADSVDGQNTSSTLQVRWDWENDGTYDTAYSATKTATKTYATIGAKTIKLEVKDSGGLVTTTTKTVEVANTSPTAVLNASPASGTTSAPITFSAADSTDMETPAASLQVRFDFENDGVFDTAWSTVKTASKTYATIGQKTCLMQVKDANGAISTATLTVSITEGSANILKVHYRNSSAWATPKMHWGFGNYAAVGDSNAAGTDSYGPYYTVNWVAADTSLKACFNDGASTWDGVDRVINKPAAFPADVWIKNADATVYATNPIDGVLPVCALTAPVSGATVSGTAVTVSATATDNVGVTKVEFYCGLTKIGEDTTAPYSITWDSTASPRGAQQVSAKAYDAGGNIGSSGAVTVTVNNPNKAPVANAGSDIFLQPGGTANFDGSGSADPDGSIVSYSWNNGLTGAKASKVYTALGTNIVTLTVTDNEGAVGMASMKVIVMTNTPVNRGDFREESIYFVITSRFYDGYSNNNRTCRGVSPGGETPWQGDFEGLVKRMDYIKALGFTAIWMTPVVLNRSDIDYHGYHAYDFNMVDKRLESPGYDFQRVINEAHSRGMKIVLDIVLNHSGRFGARGLYTPKYWGNADDTEWGDGTAIDYYDRYNPNFTYDGVTKEPNSGKHFYNGDTYQTAKPNLAWSTLPGWGTTTQYRSPEGYKIWNYQWPNLTLFNPQYYHSQWLGNWEDETCQTGTIHEDCIDLNTEDPTVQNYLINAYNRFIDMGVDSFRIDTVKHISRNTFNRRFLPAFKARGGDNFFMFGEVCSRVSEIWNHNVAPLSAPFYTWKERSTFSADDATAAHEAYVYENGMGTGNQPTSDNHYLSGNNYHTPDYSKNSGMAVIDFRMHWNFGSAGQAFGVKDSDGCYNDATWNVTYVDSHDYGHNTDNRFAGSESELAEDWALTFTFRGIPCVYYGSEIQFMKGARTDISSATQSLNTTGRAYYGDVIKDQASIDATLAKPLAKHLARLNAIRRAVPALQKGQYSVNDINAWMAFKRRYTSATVDSFALVTISGGATFNNIPNGTYVDCVTGDTQTVTGGTLTANCSGQGNIRVYVLSTAKTPAPGKIGTDTTYIHP